MILLAIFISCTDNSSSNSITLNKLGLDTTLNIKTNKEYPTTLKIKLIGNPSDTFIISGFKVPGGKVDTFWHTDWYKSNIILKYESYKAKAGELKIEYRLY